MLLMQHSTKYYTILLLYIILNIILYHIMHISINQKQNFDGPFLKLRVDLHNTPIRRTIVRGRQTYQQTALPQPSPPKQNVSTFLSTALYFLRLCLSLYNYIYLFLASKSSSILTHHMTVLLSLSTSRHSNVGHE